MGKRYDLTGKRFGRLLVIRKSDKVMPRNVVWLCKCDCGNLIEVTSGSLVKGNTRSCGCLRKETSSNKPSDHHLSKTRLYVIWRNMKDRCYNVKSAKYSSYGERGIKVCDDWLGAQGFLNFREWAFANGYDENADRFECTIDRIDVNGNYEPSNCQWVSNAFQSRNKRNTKYFIIDGQKKCLAEWCDIYNVAYSMVLRRLYNGMSIVEALTKPSRATTKRHS